MNDDHIRSELERRASSISSRPDWAKRVLLPAVRHEIDARPQRVMTSNWSPRLSVVAVVAALLIMVIAVPRLTPPPPAASPSPGPDTVLSTAEFAAGVTSGRLIGRTVLVQGRISVDATIRRGRPLPCLPPGGECALGTLDGTDVSVAARYTPTTDALGSGVWQAADGGRDYHFPAPPIEGVLVLHVGSDYAVEFVGVANQPDSIRAWPVTDAAAFDIATIGPDDVLIVRGWLVETEVPPSVMEMNCEYSVPPVILAGLPSRECQPTDFLSDVPADGTELPPRDATRISVQRSAAQQFQSRSQDEPWLFAISPRLYGGGCAGAPPCWLWDVVARLSDPPRSPSPSSPPQGPRQIPCDLPLPVVIDETGSVTSCTGSHSTPSEVAALTVTNATGDLTHLIVSWADVCSSTDTLLLKPADSGYELVVSSIQTNYLCDGLPYEYRFELALSVPIAAETVMVRYETHPPEPTPSPGPTASPPIGTRVLSCDGSEALGDPGITLIDHSGRIGGCSIAQADFVPDGPIDVTTTGRPYQLAATWTVNASCPADEQLEFWGPIEKPVGLGEYVLQLARQRSPRFYPPTCGDVLDTRQVQIGFTVEVFPTDILAISVDRSVAEDRVSSSVADGPFTLHLAAVQDQLPNEPIDVTSRLTYDGADPVTLSGDWSPNFAFTSLTRGPAFDTYGSLLLCPDAEIGLSATESVSGHLEGPITLDPTDPNYDYRTQYAYDGKVRLPSGAYLIYTGVSFNVGSNCSGERVHLWAAIVVDVGLLDAQWNF